MAANFSGQTSDDFVNPGDCLTHAIDRCLPGIGGYVHHDWRWAGRATELLSLHIYNRAFDAQLLGYASAIAVLLIVIVSVLSASILIIGNPMKDKADV